MFKFDVTKPAGPKLSRAGEVGLHHFPRVESIVCLSTIMHILPSALISLLLVSISAASSQDEAAIAAERFFARNANESSSTGHTNNWAVLVCASRYWFNYRVSWIARLFDGSDLIVLDS